MRTLLCLTLFAGFAVAQDKPIPPRFKLEADLDAYPQNTPKDALRSALKAIENKRLGYLLAHLSEPEYVDKRVKELDGKFDKMIALVDERFKDDPEGVREMRRFLADGKVEESGDTAVFKLDDVKGRQVYLKKIGDRWYLENRSKPK